MDVQFKYKNSNKFYFVEDCVKDGILMFRVEEVKWNKNNESNDRINLFLLTPASFAAWYNNIMENGWEITHH